MARDFGHVVIDTEARPNREDMEALAKGCDLLIIPATANALSLDALTLTVDLLRTIAPDRYRILLTMIPPKPSRDGEEARALHEDAGIPLCKGQIRRLVAFQKAALKGVPVYEVNNPGAEEGCKDYAKTGKEILR
jgi:chromosome partitioning protein